MLTYWDDVKFYFLWDTLEHNNMCSVSLKSSDDRSDLSGDPSEGPGPQAGNHRTPNLYIKSLDYFKKWHIGDLLLSILYVVVYFAVGFTQTERNKYKKLSFSPRFKPDDVGDGAGDPTWPDVTRCDQMWPDLLWSLTLIK